MHEPQATPRGDSAIRKMLDRTYCMKGLALVADFDGWGYANQTADTAAKLITCAIDCNKMPDRPFRTDEVTAEDIADAKRVATELLAAMDESGKRYLLICNIYGEKDVQLNFGNGEDWESALRRAIDVLNDVLLDLLNES